MYVLQPLSNFIPCVITAYIPAPIMFGNTIDASCLVWNEKCGRHGSCLLYDIVQFRYKYVGKYSDGNRAHFQDQ